MPALPPVPFVFSQMLYVVDEGDSQSVDHVLIACKDAVAILFMFDLTSRCTLTNIIDWYERARKWNKMAIPILIGTKFDDFAQLPLEMQCTIVNEEKATSSGANSLRLLLL